MKTDIISIFDSIADKLKSSEIHFGVSARIRMMQNRRSYGLIVDLEHKGKIDEKN